MAESSFFWSSIAYSDDQFSDVLRKLFITDRTEQGVIEGYLGELACSGIASPVTVASGAAMVDGKFYENTANIEITITSPVSSTRIDRVVLRKDFTAETVTVELIAGTEGTGSPPALTQTDGTTWEIPLYQVSTTTSGIISLTDERSYLYTANATVWRADNDGPDSGLNADLLDDAHKSTDDTFASNSDNLIPSEKAIKTYIEDILGDVDSYGYTISSDISGNNTELLIPWTTQSFGTGKTGQSLPSSNIYIKSNGTWEITAKVAYHQNIGGYTYKPRGHIEILLNGTQIATSGDGSDNSNFYGDDYDTSFTLSVPVVNVTTSNYISVKFCDDHNETSNVYATTHGGTHVILKKLESK